MRGDVLSPRGDDDVFFPVGDDQESLAVDVPDVPGPEPVAFENLGGLGGHLVVSLHHVGPAGEDFAVRGDPDFDARNGFPHRPELHILEGIEGDDRRSLGQAVPFKDQEADGVEEFGDVLGERSSARKEQADPSSGQVDDLFENELVGQIPFRLQKGRDGPTAELFRPVLFSDLQGPEKDFFLQRGVGQDIVHDAGVDFFEDAGRADHQVGPDFEKVLAQGVHAFSEGDCAPVVKVSEHADPFQGVRQGKEGESDFLVRDIDDGRGADGVADEVGVGQHRSLGDPGRPRGVDNRRQVPVPYGLRRGLEPAGVLAVELFPHLPDLVERVDTLRGGLVERDKIPDMGECLFHGLDFLPDLPVGKDDDPGFRVVDDVFDLFGGQDGMDRDGDPSGADIGQVGHHPPRAAFGEDDQPVPGPMPEGRKAERELPHPLGELRGRNRPVAPAFLVHHIVVLRVGRDRVQEKLGQCFDHFSSLLSPGCQTRRDSKAISSCPSLFVRLAGAFRRLWLLYQR